MATAEFTAACAMKSPVVAHATDAKTATGPAVEKAEIVDLVGKATETFVADPALIKLHQALKSLTYPIGRIAIEKDKSGFEQVLVRLREPPTVTISIWYVVFCLYFLSECLFRGCDSMLMGKYSVSDETVTGTLHPLPYAVDVDSALRQVHHLADTARSFERHELHDRLTEAKNENNRLTEIIETLRAQLVVATGLLSVAPCS